MKRPVLRYHGGKFRIADWVISFFPEHLCYVEPYGGGASVLMRKQRVGTEIYNDLDADIVNLFNVIRDEQDSQELFRLMYFTPFSRADFDSAYGRPTNHIDQARKLLIRSFMGHGSDAATRAGQPGFRTKRSNSKGFSQSPAVEFSSYPKEILNFHERLKGVVIENRPAVELIQQFDSPNTLVYIDPPYCISTRSLMKGSADRDAGYRYEMSDEDHRELAEVLYQCQSMVVLSGYPTDLYDKELYSHWQRFDRKSTVEGGGSRTEVVWVNPACSAALINERVQQRLV